ncbi:general transcription factor 3C polypeptide 3 [Dorcoceras hygrometricum]|uniref:General transcription factor 3C polypeptide 3 n=1 Tax=Dorcoceras hygrometricum TaxID=472368 RepID=A0A2Z7AY32_9LAMI|nr:general transcription factor 3C polypeptide 3 [Dorcoceras hygrometricum]
MQFNVAEDPIEIELESEQDVETNEACEEGETTDDDEECTLLFQGEMDPITFVEEDNTSELQPYQRLEQMQNDYEILAAKKRRILDREICEIPSKRVRQEEFLGASFEEIMETFNFGMKKKSRKSKQRGRRKGSKNKVNPEVAQKLGDATLHYAHGHFEEAICVLKEVIRLSPNLSAPYHQLGLIYKAMDDRKKALNFYMIAAHLSPRDASLWKLLVTWSIELGDKKQANYCLGKAITADPEDIDLQFQRASLFVELGEHQKAADSYEQISRLYPDNIEVLRIATQLYQKCGQNERAVRILEDHLRNHNHIDGPVLSLVDLLASILMDSYEYAKVLDHIEHTQKVNSAGKEIPLSLVIKAGICHVHLTQLEKAEAFFSALQPEHSTAYPQLIMDVADSLMTVNQYGSALKYYMMLEREGNKYNGYLHLKIARCCVSLKKRAQAVEYYYKAIQKLNDGVDARLTLSSLLLEEDRDDEAIAVLSPPVESESTPALDSTVSRPWWHSGRIKLKLSQIYKAKGCCEAFVNVIFPVIRETLFLESVRRKVKPRKRLSRSILSERVKVLDDNQTDGVFHRFRPVASSADLSKASRAKKLLLRKDAIKEAKRSAALAAGIDWESDDSDEESPVLFPEPPLPDLLKDEGHHHVILDLCKSLSSLQRYWEALEIINLCLKVECNTFPVGMKEELRTLGARIAYNLADPANGWDCVRYLVSQHPYSFAAWSCYYKALSKFGNRFSKHNKFLHNMRTKHKDSVPPILISGHLFTMISQHQAAAREYLEAYKLMPDDPLVNLCAGTALINLALGHRLQNKHQAVLQGLSFLHNNARLCKDNQESLFNIGRAYHHVGLVTLAAIYYEKVLAIHQNDFPIPKLPDESQDKDTKGRGYCDLRREAAYNLHLIYKTSGASDLARQILKRYVVV